MKNTTRFALGALLSSLCLAAGAQGDGIAKAERVAKICAACHGADGNSSDPFFPKLAGQPAFYTQEQLRLFREQKRADPSAQAYMWGVTALLDDQMMHDLAEFYAQQRPTSAKVKRPELLARGQKIYHEGVAAKGVRPCASCHGEAGEGAGPFPRLAGQHAEYTVRQLQEFRTKLRPYAVIMSGFVKGLSNEDMSAVAEYLASK
jgi:cytochrome c553